MTLIAPPVRRAPSCYIRRMKFVAWDDDHPLSGALSVDGVAGEGPNLSHWPGNRTPRHLKADTSTEIVLKALVDPDFRRQLATIDTVTNNHFDTDGVLSAALVLHPGRFAGLEQLFIDAAKAGDLDLFTGEQAVILDLCVAGLVESDDSPIARQLAELPDVERLQLSYDEALARLPEIIASPSAYLALWEDELVEIRASMAAFTSGAARIAAYVPESDVSLVLSDRWLHPLAVWSHAQASRVMVATQVEDGHTFEFRYGTASWFDLPEPRPPRRDLTLLLEQLAGREVSKDGRWAQLGELDDLVPGIAFVDADEDLVASKLDPNAVFQAIAWHLRDRSIARSF